MQRGKNCENEMLVNISLSFVVKRKRGREKYIFSIERLSMTLRAGHTQVVSPNRKAVEYMRFDCITVN